MLDVYVFYYRFVDYMLRCSGICIASRSPSRSTSRCKACRTSVRSILRCNNTRRFPSSMLPRSCIRIYARSLRRKCPVRKFRCSSPPCIRDCRDMIRLSENTVRCCCRSIRSRSIFRTLESDRAVYSPGSSIRLCNRTHPSKDGT